MDAEFKVKIEKSHSFLGKETIVTSRISCDDAQQAHDTAVLLSEYYEGREIRWNWVGSSGQGHSAHYVKEV